MNGLLKEIPLHTNSVSAEAVIRAGATNLRQLTSDDSALRAVQDGYAQAVVATLYLALAAACVSLPFAVSMEWKSVRQDTKKQVEDKSGLEMVSDIKEGSSGIH